MVAMGEIIMDDKFTIELKNDSKIILAESNEKIRGFNKDLPILNDYFVDLPPECVKLIDENFDNLLLE